RSTPLFEEERHALNNTPVSNCSDPSRIDTTCAGTRLSTDNHPMNTSKRQTRNRPQQWLDRWKPYGRWYFPQVLNAIDIVCVLNTPSHPDVVMPGKFSREFKKSLRAFG